MNASHWISMGIVCICLVVVLGLTMLITQLPRTAHLIENSHTGYDFRMDSVSLDGGLIFALDGGGR